MLYVDVELQTQFTMSFDEQMFRISPQALQWFLCLYQTHDIKQINKWFCK